MDEAKELEIRRALQAAVQSGDAKAELAARRELAALQPAQAAQPMQQQPQQPEQVPQQAPMQETPGAGSAAQVDQLRGQWQDADIMGGIATMLEKSPIVQMYKALQSGENPMQYWPGAGAVETGAALATGLAGQAAGGLAGIGQGVANMAGYGEMPAADRVERVSQALTYEPRTPSGQAAAEQLAPVGGAIQFAGEAAGTGMAAAGERMGIDESGQAALYATGNVLPDLIPIKGARGAQQQAIQPPAAGQRDIVAGIRAAESGGQTARARQTAMQDLAVAVDPQADIGRAFERSGIPQQAVPPQVLSGNKEFREVAGAARSVPASPASQQWNQFIQTVSDRVDTIAKELDAQPMSVVNERVSGRLNSAIDEAREVERAAYDAVESAIDPGTVVDVSPIYNKLMSRLDEVGGDVGELSKFEQSLLGRYASRSKETGQWTPKQKTWSAISGLRKDMNAARSGQGQFLDATTGELNAYGNLVSSTQRGIADANGFGDVYAAAMDATGVKKRAQEAAQAALGKALDKSFSAKLDTAGGKLAKGQFEEFETVMRSLPDEMSRLEAAKALVFDKVIDTRNQGNRLDTARFQSWYNQVNANPQAKAALYKYLDDDTRKAVENIGKMSGAIKRANEDFIKTGRLQTLDEGFRLADSLIGKLGRYALIAKMPGVGGMLADVAAGAVSKGNRKIAQAASDLIGDPEFHNVVIDVMLDPNSAKAAAAERALTKSQKWRRFYGSLDKRTRAAIDSVGVIEWLRQQEEETE